MKGMAEGERSQSHGTRSPIEAGSGGEDDEKHSWYIEDNIRTYTEAGQVNANDPDFEESNVMRCKIMKKFLIPYIL